MAKREVEQLGADTGGTFTDFVDASGAMAKRASTPTNPAEALGQGVGEYGTVGQLNHGTTVATNAVLERRGARVGLLTTAGFEDEIEIARQTRPDLYDGRVQRPEPLVAREDRYGVDQRMGPDGSVLNDLANLPAIDEDIEALAVCLLHADLNPSHEVEIGEQLAKIGIPFSFSAQVSPQYREYERLVTTVMNAYLQPVITPYLHEIAGLADSVRVMNSIGGLHALGQAASRPVDLLLSGPAAGAQAASQVALECGYEQAVSFDMGGTSTDVCLLLEGEPQPAGQLEVGGLPVRVPALNIHTIGAGGGSIAFLDAGGALKVGPSSAGAFPGPVCYGWGGDKPTVTDANLLLGRIPETSSFGELSTLDKASASQIMSEADLSPEGIISVVDQNMALAVRKVTIEQGVDPRECALVSFGGSGSLHAVAIAELLEMPEVIVPPRSGVYSAVGLLNAQISREYVQSLHADANQADVDRALKALRSSAEAEYGSGIDFDFSVDCRYRGQSHELRAQSITAFHDVHRQVNGYERRSEQVEPVAARLRVQVIGQPVTLPPVNRVVKTLAGEAGRVVAEQDSTIFIPPGWQVDVDEQSNYRIHRAS